MMLATAVWISYCVLAQHFSRVKSDDSNLPNQIDSFTQNTTSYAYDNETNTGLYGKGENESTSIKSVTDSQLRTSEMNILNFSPSTQSSSVLPKITWNPVQILKIATKSPSLSTTNTLDITQSTPSTTEKHSKLIETSFQTSPNAPTTNTIDFHENELDSEVRGFENDNHFLYHGTTSTSFGVTDIETTVSITSKEENSPEASNSNYFLSTDQNSSVSSSPTPATVSNNISLTENSKIGIEENVLETSTTENLSTTPISPFTEELFSSSPIEMEAESIMPEELSFVTTSSSSQPTKEPSLNDLPRETDSTASTENNSSYDPNADLQEEKQTTMLPNSEYSDHDENFKTRDITGVPSSSVSEMFDKQFTTASTVKEIEEDIVTSLVNESMGSHDLSPIDLQPEASSVDEIYSSTQESSFSSSSEMEEFLHSSSYEVPQSTVISPSASTYENDTDIFVSTGSPSSENTSVQNINTESSVSINDIVTETTGMSHLFTTIDEIVTTNEAVELRTSDDELSTINTEDFINNNVFEITDKNTEDNSSMSTTNNVLPELNFNQTTTKIESELIDHTEADFGSTPSNDLLTTTYSPENTSEDAHSSSTFYSTEASQETTAYFSSNQEVDFVTESNVLSNLSNGTSSDIPIIEQIVTDAVNLSTAQSLMPIRVSNQDAADTVTLSTEQSHTSFQISEENTTDTLNFSSAQSLTTTQVSTMDGGIETSQSTLPSDFNPIENLSESSTRNVDHLTNNDMASTSEVHGGHFDVGPSEFTESTFSPTEIESSTEATTLQSMADFTDLTKNLDFFVTLPSLETSSLSQLTTATHREGKHIPFSTAKSKIEESSIAGVIVVSSTTTSEPQVTRQDSYEVPFKQREYEDLSLSEKENVLTAVIQLPSEYHNEDDINEKFAKIHQWIHTVLQHGYRNNTINIFENESKAVSDTTVPADLLDIIYIFPTPEVTHCNITVTFYTLNTYLNESLPADVSLFLLKSHSDDLLSLVNASAAHFDHGLLQGNQGFLTVIIEKYGIIVVATCLAALLMIILLVCIVVYYRRKSRYSAHSLTNDKLHRNMQEAMGLDLNPAVVILQDELKEKALNGNKICSIDDNEGWLVPFTDVPVEEDKNAPCVQDTKL